MTGGSPPRHELVFMCADTGAVVCLAESAAAPRVTIFLASGETLWGEADRGAGLTHTGGRSEVRMSATCSLFTAPAHIVRDEPVAYAKSVASAPARSAGLRFGPGQGGRQVAVSLAVTVEPAGVPVTLPGSAPQEVVVVQVAGSLGVGSVIYRIGGSGWLSPSPSPPLPPAPRAYAPAPDKAPGTAPAGGAGDPYGCRARAVFQDRSAAYLTDGTDAAAALMRHTEIRRAPVDEFVVRGADRGPASHLRCAVGGRSPSVVSGEARDTEQYLTFASPAPGGDGWLWWSASPFVFVRSGVTGLGLVERGIRSDSPRTSPPAVDDLPDPY